MMSLHEKELILLTVCAHAFVLFLTTCLVRCSFLVIFLAAVYTTYCLPPEKFRKIFGSYNFGQMIETSYLSVSALSAPDSGDASPPPPLGKPNEALVGFATLSDSPRAGTSEDWLEWFSETHAPVDTEVTMTNTLWMDFAVAVSPRALEAGTGGSSTKDEHTAEQDEEDAAKVIEDIVRTVFNTLPELDYLVMSLPGSGNDASGSGGSSRKGGIPTPTFLLSTFEVLTRHANASPNNLDEALGQPLLLLCDRMAFLPTLAVSSSTIGSCLCVQEYITAVTLIGFERIDLGDIHPIFTTYVLLTGLCSMR